MIISDKLPIENFHTVDRYVYRSAQPNLAQFLKLREDYGIKTVINLRDNHADPQVHGIKMVHIPMKAYLPTKQNVVDFVTAIKDAVPPMLIHCQHGSDRTGLMVAIYQIKFNHWTRSKAMKQMKSRKYGFHDEFWNRTDEFLKNLDVEWLRSL